MKTISTLRSLLLLSILAPAAVSAVQAADSDVKLTRQLDLQGEIPVREAGPYVQVGSYRIWVSSHLGRPAVILPDGTWLYRGYQVDDSEVRGTLAVSFQNGQVSSLKLLSSARVAALMSAKPKSGSIASR